MASSSRRKSNYSDASRESSKKENANERLQRARRVAREQAADEAARPSKTLSSAEPPLRLRAPKRSRIALSSTYQQVRSFQNEPDTKSAPPKEKGKKQSARLVQKDDREEEFTPSSSVSPTERKAEQQRRARDKRRRQGIVRRILIGLAGLVVLGLATWGVIALLHAPAFAVGHIEVLGAEPLPTADVRELAAIPKGQTTLLLDKKGLTERLLRNTWIKDVAITRDLPRGVTLTLTMRRVAACVELEDGKRWLLSDDGLWLASWDATNAVASDPNRSFKAFSWEASRLVEVKDIEKLKPKVGEKNRNPVLRNALSILRGLSRELSADIVELLAPDIMRTSLRTKDGIELDIGSADDIATKDKIIREVLSEQQGKVVLVNVRSIERPTWRGLSR